MTVKTAVHHFAIRSAIREGWLQDTKNYGNKFGVFFIVGHSKNPEHEQYVKQEQDKYGDMIMAKMIDSYDNVTKKVVLGMAFVYEKCKNVEYFLHVDDDTYFSPIRFMRIMYSKIEQQIKDPTAIIGNYTDLVHCAYAKTGKETYPIRRCRQKCIGRRCTWRCNKNRPWIVNWNQCLVC